MLQVHMYERDREKKAFVATENPNNWDIAIVFRGTADTLLSPDDRADIAKFAKERLNEKISNVLIKNVLEKPEFVEDANGQR
jgi:hypothetical protein